MSVTSTSTGRLLPMGLAATVAYEFRMAVRRKVLWLAMLPLLVLAVLVSVTSSRITELAAVDAKVGTWAVVVNIFAAIGLGVVLADRFVRTHTMGLAELLASTPTGIGVRMLGVLVGSLAAGLVPVLASIVFAVPLICCASPDRSRSACCGPAWQCWQSSCQPPCSPRCSPPPRH